jgi:redox-sensitive bicupin YhaK (pirin superfamily)
MKTVRSVERIIAAKPTIEGAGVRLKRVFGYRESPMFDPFLLLDHFGSADPADYLPGFPWHPHRGIETVTYMIDGSVAHGDSMHNTGIIHSGDLQWMTAGSGIIHQEMPIKHDGLMRGFQLWVNLPARSKMMPPRYRGITASEIPELSLPNAVVVKIIAGSLNGARGPVEDLVVPCEYLDVTIPSGGGFEHSIASNHTVFAYVFEGSGTFGDQGSAPMETGQMVHFGQGEIFRAEAAGDHVRFILVTGEPLGEPVAWRGPIVMNTEDELKVAFQEFDDGTFIKEH